MERRRSVPRPPRMRKPDLGWVRDQVVYGLPDDFAGPRWVASAGTSSLGLGHGDREDRGPALITGIMLQRSGGSIDVADSVASIVLVSESQERLLKLSPGEVRRAEVERTMADPVASVEWGTLDVALDGDVFTFVCARLGPGWWSAGRTFGKTVMTVDARRWPEAATLVLVRVDLADYQPLPPGL